MNRHDKVEPILYLLTVVILFFAAALIGVEYFFKQDGQVFQVFAGSLTGFTGAFLARIKPAQADKHSDTETDSPSQP